MIVLHRDGRLVLIRQLEHAALAGRLAAAWGDAVVAIPFARDAVILATSRHDEGWRENDDRTLYDPRALRPLSFLDVDIDAYVALYTRGIDRIAGLDPYAGLLTSMHGTGNVCGRWGNQRGVRLTRFDETAWRPVIERFVVTEEARQTRLRLAVLGTDPSSPRSRFERELWTSYDLLQIWDRLSLFLCRSEPGDAVEADLGGVGEVRLRVAASPGGAATVEPWPFDRDELEVEISFVELPDRDYDSQADVDREAGRSEGRILRWDVSRSPLPVGVG